MVCGVRVRGGGGRGGGGGGGLSSVRAQHPNIPLIVNTYGWLHDMCSVYVVVVWRGGGGGGG